MTFPGLRPLTPLNTSFRIRYLRPLSAGLLAAICSVALPAASLDSGKFKPLIDETKVTTLFAFDNHSIPFTRSLEMNLNQPEKYSGNPVVPLGKKGEADEWAVQFYGSVLRENGKFRMWYAALDGARGQSPQHNSSLWRPAYAESVDGVNWVKPKLGLVEYKGNKDNNLLAFEPVLGPINVKVLHEPEDPDPSRRYKLVAHVYWLKGGEKRHGTLVPYASADGFTWKSLVPITPQNAELPESQLLLPPMHIEPAGGLFKWDGMYVSSGQNPFPGTRPTHARIVRQFRSRDFVEWSQTSHVAFVRAGQYDLQPVGNAGRQSHEGISVWNRGNVLLGLMGLWQGKTGQWPEITIDLAFVISNDGLQFREPIEERVYIPIGPDGAWDQGGLVQGQGFENVGDKTYLYYGAWDPRTWSGYEVPIPARGGVGLATLPRDRFGDLRVRDYGEGASEFITTSLPVNAGERRRFYLNADGLAADAALKIELLNHDEQPLPDYSGSNAALVTQSGFQTPIAWKNRTEISGLPQRFRIKVTFVGDKKAAIRFSALYIQP